MRALGIILLIVAGVTWVGGGNLVFAAQRRRLYTCACLQPFSIRFMSFTAGEKRWLLALLLATCVIGLLGLASLQGAFG